jgi:hypothetical protein
MAKAKKLKGKRTYTKRAPRWADRSKRVTKAEVEAQTQAQSGSQASPQAWYTPDILAHHNGRTWQAEAYASESAKRMELEARVKELEKTAKQNELWFDMLNRLIEVLFKGVR